ncbi:hypothetical protein EYE42_05920 [Paracoccus subflavus]|uniref:Translation initiation factor 2 n=1 Tax=Paracoccus subflavus TaxID=2528244 RepID=A0A4V6MTE0_9RHOB|nr:hypothetical protein [Paracoccus subflavus]TBN41936.1 hypothetical protein EYE42_05920 [Paracoccus subflavus]
MNKHIAPPDFAMSFTPEAVLLEQRDGLDWRPLGEARFAGREMTERLAALRAQTGTRPGSLDTVLVIPDDQILYTTLTVPVGADTPTAIARALEAMTPYEAADLAFDWCPSENGDIETLRVAAVARRTLDEAEDFACAQGFRPQGFVARPQDGRFDGQPDFGPSRLASERFARTPFSEPDLTQARVTDPAVPVVADPAPQPNQPSPALAAPMVSRIVPHVAPAVVPAQVTPQPQPVATPLIQTAEAAPTVPGVIRHGDARQDEARGPVAPRVLPPRAQAVHDRARQARADRERGGDAPKPAVASSLLAGLRRLDPGRLPVLMGVLVLGLAIVWIAFGQPSDTPDAAAEVAAIAPETASDTAPRTGTVPAPDTQSPSGAASLGEDAPVQPAAAIPAPARSEQALEAAAPEAGTVSDPAAAQSAAVPQTTAPLPAAEATAQTPLSQPAPPSAATAEVPAPVPAPTPQALATAPAPTTTTARPAPDAQPEPDSDALSQALAQAMTVPQGAEPQAPVSSAASVADDAAAAFPPATRRPAAPEAAPVTGAPQASRSADPAAPVASPAPAGARLASSARPPRVAPVRAAPPAQTDARPTVPANPQPPTPRQTATPQTAAPQTATPAADVPAIAASRPPRPPASRPDTASQPALPPAPAAAPQRASSPASDAPRPPSRPERLGLIEEGSRAEDRDLVQLTQAERRTLIELLRDLRTAQSGNPGLTRTERDAVVRLAEARPLRKPVSVGGPSQRAVQDAVAAAAAGSEQPASRSSALRASTAGLDQSARPSARPAGARTVARGDPGPGPGPGNASLSGAAIDQAVAAAISENESLPGAVALTALRSSALPPRRAAGAAVDAAAAIATAVAAAPLAPTSEDLRAAAQAQNEEAALAEQRRQDAELQAQAEARARARAAQDAQAESQARAQAEARARAQAEAEARAAAARQQRYAPPEAENEPEVAAAIPDGRTPTTAGNAATVKDGIRINRTQIIGTIGAGKASRALVRLSNGRVLTLRLGDRINGGTITDIGDSRITFVKGGQAQALSVLGGQ